ncbi:ABC transporter ATP-binding protein [Paenibacillus sp. FSL R7-0048]|uniref:ABC transporter ATP-binding protein n=1 Tax=Paenibacillus sp. FSL R7-0048 TaxID=2954528 RepID=UPI0030F5037F
MANLVDRNFAGGSIGVATSLIELEQISKQYGRRPVLEDVSFTIEKGTVTALIGRNGSGKSTLLSILAGLVHISSGKLSCKDPNLRIGYAPEMFPGLKLTPEQYLRSMGQISGLAPVLIEQELTTLFQLFKLEHFRKQSMLDFSKGMLQKINLIQSLLGSPSLLLLDEPMSGLDLPSMNKLADLLIVLRNKGTAIVFSVHEPQWIELLADQVHVIHEGKIVKSIQGSEKLNIKPSTYILLSNLSIQKLQQLKEMAGFISINTFKDSCNIERTALTVTSSESDTFLRVILESGGSIQSVEPRGGSHDLEKWMNPRS